jgi:hypothetical protein
MSKEREKQYWVDCNKIVGGARAIQVTLDEEYDKPIPGATGKCPIGCPGCSRLFSIKDIGEFNIPNIEPIQLPRFIQWLRSTKFTIDEIYRHFREKQT